MNKVVIIFGPTATGKTNLAIKLAKRYQGVVVNFDSLLFYNEISIGTAKPTEEEKQGIKHFLFSHHSIFKPINAHDYILEATPLINELLKTSHVFLVGGSGFYLKALLNGMYDDLSTPPDISKKSNELYLEHGITPFLEVLKNYDPINYQRLSHNDHYRIRRAVEYFWTTNTAFSCAEKNFTEVDKKVAPNWKTLPIYLDIPVSEHYDIIIERTKKMIKEGLVKEVENLIKNGATGNEKPLNSIGYKETIQFLNGTLKNEKELIEEIFIATRQLAKSQRTWFKKIYQKSYHPLKDEEIILKTVQDFLC